VAALACAAAPAWGAFPYGSGTQPKVGPGEVPNDIAGDDNEFKYSATPEPGSPYTSDPKELFGVRGGHVVDRDPSVETAWQTTTGRPDVAIAVDVTHATDAPGVDEKEVGSHPLGSGPAIGRGSTLSPKVFELLVETAEAEGIEYSISASGRGTSTDADVLQISRSGIPTGLVSIPLRYMHSPVEMVDLRDVEAAVELLAAFASRLTADIDFSR